LAIEEARIAKKRATYNHRLKALNDCLCNIHPFIGTCSKEIFLEAVEISFDQKAKQEAEALNQDIQNNESSDESDNE
jgi:hypothetical protein